MDQAIALLLGLAFLISGTAAAQTWEPIQGPQVASSVRDISLTANGAQVFAADGSYLLKSTNSGQGYAVPPVPYTAPLVVLVKPDDSSKVVVAKNGELRYNDKGGTADQWIAKITDATLIPLRLSAAVNDPLKMLLGRTWAGNRKSISRSADGGVTWAPVDNFTDSTSIYDFAPYPDTGSDGRASTILAVGAAPDGVPDGSTESSLPADAGLWKSTNYGLTWEGVGLGGMNLISVAIVPVGLPDPYHRIVVENVGDTTYQVRRSATLGNTWTIELSLNTVISMVRLKKSNDYLFLATGQGVYRSTDKGDTWVQVNSGLGNDLNVLSVAPTAEGNTVFAGTAGSLYRSTNNGTTWTNVGDTDFASVEAAFTVGVQRAWGVSRDNNLVSRFVDGAGWSSYALGGVGVPWSLEDAYRNPHNGTLVVAGAKQGAARLATSGNEGVSYSEPSQPVFTSGRYRGSVAHPTQTGTMYAFGGGLTAGNWRNLVTSEDGGQSWSVAAGSVPGTGEFEVRDLVAVRVSPVIMYAALSDGNVFRSGNGGLNWSLSVDVGSVAHTLAVNPTSADTVYAGGDAGLWRTSNNGTSWIRIRTDPVVDVLVHPSWGANRERIWVVAGGRIYSTTNAGGSWTDVTGAVSGKTITGLRGDVVHKGYIYASTTDGVYRVNEPPAMSGFSGSIVGGHPSLSWTGNEELDIANYEVWRYHQTCSYYCPSIKGCTDVDAPVLIASPTGTGFADNSEQVTPCPGINGIAGVVAYYVKAVDNDGARTASGHVKFRQATGDPLKQGDGGGELPEAYSMGEAYPNPFNPSTALEYALPEPGEVHLAVYDLLGREIAVLVSEKLETGYHQAVWDGQSMAGLPVASGVYIARLVVKTETGVKYLGTTKLALMK